MVNFAVIDHIVIHDALLTRVASFLTNKGEERLAGLLTGLQQDAGTKYFNDIGNGLDAYETIAPDIDRIKDFVGNDDLEATGQMLSGFEELSDERFNVFGHIEMHLRGQDLPLETDFAGFTQKLNELLKPVPALVLTARDTGRDFSP